MTSREAATVLAVIRDVDQGIGNGRRDIYNQTTTGTQNHQDIYLHKEVELAQLRDHTYLKL